MEITRHRLKQIIKEELQREDAGEGMSPQKKLDAAKKAVMGLLDAAKDMGESPSHVTASEYASYVSKEAGIIMDMLVSLENRGLSTAAE
jgi:hypothetical protein